MLELEKAYIFQPDKKLYLVPEDIGIKPEGLLLQTKDNVRLHGWWLRGKGERALVWYHGNAGNISYSLNHAKSIIEVLGVDVLLVDYRGYGLSEGNPSEEGFYIDGFAMYDEAVRSGYKPEDVIFYGHSVGTAVAIEVAKNVECGALILESPLLSIPAMAEELFSLFPFLSEMIETKFDNESKVSKVFAPKLFIYAEHDDMIPFHHVKTLFNAAAPPKELITVKGASHNNIPTVGGKEYLEGLKAFLEKYSSSRK